MRVNKRARLESYLKFNVKGVGGKVESAQLWLYTTDRSRKASYVTPVSSRWKATRLTWKTRPSAVRGAGAARVRPTVPAGRWRKINVTHLVSKNGYYSFRISGSRGDTVAWRSARASGRRPLLKVWYAVPDAQWSAPVTTTPGEPGAYLLHDTFSHGNGLLTNQYAYWNPTLPAARTPNWETTSGSLFAANGSAWTGVPDNVVPNAASSNGNRSVISRIVSRRSDFGNVRVSVDMLAQGFTSTSETPAVSWDGAHIFLRYQSPYHLYYASVNRRDGVVMIKKKVPGGDSNNGTYHPLTREVKNAHPVPMGQWQKAEATIRTNVDGSVTIAVWVDGRKYAEATDSGTGGPPITKSGKVGLRLDNFNLRWDNFSVAAL